MKNSRLLLFAVALALLAAPVAAQDRVDAEATAMIKEYTTDPQFLTPLVDYLPESDTVPSQLEFLGYISGTPGRHTYYADIVRYYRALGESSDRVAVFEMGATDRGVMQIAVAISDAETIRDLDKYAALAAELSDPRACDEARLREILPEAKAIYLISGGLHSPETGAPEMLMELAYRLAVSEREIERRIRDGVITLIVPVFEVDGWNRMVDWYNRHTKKYEKIEDVPMSSPPYWGDYVQHDNNRDGIMVSQKLSRSFFDLFFRFHPQVALDLHESVPLLYISTGTGPFNTSTDPVTINEWHWYAFNEVTQMTKYGVPGVWTHGFYTGWYPGYMLWLPNNHNAIGRFYETFGNAGANTYERDIARGRRAGATSVQWYRPLPPPAKVKWSLRNNNSLMESGVLLSLDFTARNRDTVLDNYWRKGKNALDRGSTEKPFAWIVPLEQRDNAAAELLLRTLRLQRVELHALTEDFKSGEVTYPKGSVVVRMDQPYRTVAKTLLEVQTWPEDNQNNPYDATAWTLGLMLGVETKQIDDKAVLEARMAPIGDDTVFEGAFEGQGDFVFVAPQGIAMMTALVKLEEKGMRVEAAEEEFNVGDRTFPAGAWVIPEADIEQAKAILGGLGLDAFCAGGEDLAELPPPLRHEISIPRLAMYHPWFNTQESGWTRFALEQSGIPFKLLNKERVKAGNLGADFDVIIVPHAGGYGNGLRFLRGVDPRQGPLAYNRTDEYKFLGSPDSSNDITGGLGFDGLMEIEKFIQGGGTLLAFGSGCSIVTDFGLVGGVRSAPAQGVTCPGTILTTTVLQPGHPIAYGYGSNPPVYRGTVPMLSVADYAQKYVVLQFGTKPPGDQERQEAGPYGGADEGEQEAAKPKAKKLPLLLSGLLRGGQALDGSPAIIDAPVGKGRVVLIAFNPMYRWMNQASFAFAHNAIANWKAPAELREKKQEEKKQGEGN